MNRHLDLFLPEWQGFGENRSVFDGAFALRDQLSRNLSFSSIDVLPNEKLEIENDVLGYRSNLELLKTVRDLIAKKDPSSIFMIGGTCASEIAPVSFLNKKYPHDLTVLWFDAHGDLNTPQSSPSKHLHGMPLRILLGDGPNEMRALMFSELLHSQVILCGGRDFDPPEIAYVTENEMTMLSISALREGDALVPCIRNRGSNHIYIHLDLDVLEPKDFPHLLIPTSGGLMFDELADVLGQLGEEFTIVGSSIVEYVPAGEGDPKRMERLVGLLRRMS